MKKFLLIFQLILFSIVSGQVSIEKLYLGPLNGIGFLGFSICKADSGSFMIAGEYENKNGGAVVKIDSLGNTIWFRSIGGLNDNLRCIVPTLDSNYIVAGGRYNGFANREAFMIKLKPDGDTLWSKLYSFNGIATILSVTETYNHGYSFTGWHYYPGSIYKNIMVARTDSIGNLLWSELISVTNCEYWGTSIEQTADSGFIVGGYSIDYGGPDGKAFLCKLSSSGAISWTKRYTTMIFPQTFGADLLSESNGFVYLCTTGDGSLLMKTNLNGDPLWCKSGFSYGAVPINVNIPFGNLLRTSDMGYAFITGNYNGANLSGLTKTDSTGNMTHLYSTTQDSKAAVELPNGSFVLVGLGPLYGYLPQTILTAEYTGLIKIDSNNQPMCHYNTWVNVISDSVIVQSANSISFSTGSAIQASMPIAPGTMNELIGCVDVIYSVSEVKNFITISFFPNPTSGIFNISTKENLFIESAEVFDVHGRLVLSEKFANQNKCEINLNHQANGIYFVRARADGKILNGRVAVVK